MTRFERDTPDREWDRESDVVIIGSGGGGIAAAVSAAEGGADVLVLEKSDQLGGLTRHASNHFNESPGALYLGGGTAVQRECGVSDSVENMYAYLAARVCNAVPDAIVRKYSEESVAHYEWLVENGVSFPSRYVEGKQINLTPEGGLYMSGAEAAHPYRTIAEPVPRGHTVKGGADMLWHQLYDVASSMGVSFETETKGESLVVDADNRVVGVVVSGADAPSRIRARKGVIIATGGFGKNPEMMEKYLPDWTDKHPAAMDHQDGSGIQMGISVGANTKNMDKQFGSLYLYPPESMFSGILVNANGVRFTAEDCYAGELGSEIVRNQPGDVVYLILDDALATDVEVGRNDRAKIGSGGQWTVAAVAETIDELAEEVGITPLTLRETVDSYNRLADRTGRDPAFDKHEKYVRPLEDGPFYALEARTDRFSYFTRGGLEIDADGRVLDAYGEPIDGLYATSRAVSGIASGRYDSGLSLGGVTFFGRVAGQHASSASAR